MITPRWYVFAGGGMRGVAYVGALERCADLIRGDVRGYAGVSIGALIAFLLAVGYNVGDVRRIALDLDYSTLQHVDEDSVINILDDCGIDDGAFLREFLEKLLADKGLKSTATFGDLKPSVSLRVYACRLRDGVTVEFSARHTPNTSIVDALCASMAVPLYFVPVEIGGERYVDGGVTNNYPIDMLGPAEQRHALGFLFKKNVDPCQDGFLEYGKQLVKIMGMDRYRAQLRRFEEQTILIDCGMIDLLDFNMSTETKEGLIQAGTDAVDEFMKRRRKPPVRRWSVS